MKSVSWLFWNSESPCAVSFVVVILFSFLEPTVFICISISWLLDEEVSITFFYLLGIVSFSSFGDDSSVFSLRWADFLSSAI